MNQYSVNTLKAPPISPRAFRAEKARRYIVNLILIIYWLLIFEGALRKWFLPQIQQILFFIRDPFVFLAYWTMIKQQILPKSNILKSFLAVGMLVFVLLPVYMMLYDLNFLIPIYGWRNYFLYAPLAFLIGQSFNKEDFDRLIKQNLWIAIPLSVLSFMQFSSPPDSYINKGLAEAGERVFLVTTGIVRVYGTFTFTVGQAYYVSSLLAMVVYCWLIPKFQRPVGFYVLLAASFASISMVLLSGSRTALILSGLNIFIAFLSSTAHAKNKARSVGFIVVFAMVIVVLFTTVFEKSYEAMKGRQESSGSFQSSIVDRIAETFTGFLDILGVAPILGFGPGFGTGGGSTIATGMAQFTLAENEWDRIIWEIGPLLGLVYIGLRCFFALDLAKRAYNSASKQQNPLAMLLFAFVLPTLLNGPMTMQGTINGYVWLFCGFTIAASRLNQQRNLRR